MKRLGDLFSVQAIPGFKEAHIRHVIAETLTRALQIPIVPKQVQFKDGIAFLAVAPVVKSAIQLKAEELQKTLAQSGVSVSAFK